MVTGCTLNSRRDCPLVYSFRGGQSDQTADANATINAIYTNAMSTVAAQQLTLQAGTITATPTPVTLIPPTLPRFTPTPRPFPTLVPTSAFSTASTSACDSSVYIADVTIPNGTYDYGRSDLYQDLEGFQYRHMYMECNVSNHLDLRRRHEWKGDPDR